MSTQPDLSAVDRQMARDDGGPAFPSLHAYPQGGMSLRDYFAGQTLAICLSGGDEPPGTPKAIAWFAYQVADAMIAERTR